MPKATPQEHGLPSLALVFGYIAVKELQRLEDRVVVLSRLGYGNVEIAKICGWPDWCGRYRSSIALIFQTRRSHKSAASPCSRSGTRV